MKKRKIIAIVVIILLVIIYVTTSIIFKSKSKNKEPEFEIVKIEKQTLINTINCSGTIATEERKNVTSLLNGYKVTNVNVNVGDKVEIGDVLVNFDVGTLKKSASDLSTSISATKQQTNISVSGAERAVQDAQNAKNTGLDNAKAAKDQAQIAYDHATAAYNATNDQINSLKSQISGLEPTVGQYKNMQADVATKQAAYDTANTAYTNAIETNKTAPGTVGDIEVLNLENKKNIANTELQTSKAALAGLEPSFQQYTALNSQLTQLNASLPELQSAASQAKTAYEQADRTYSSTSANLDSSILNAQDAAATAKINSKTSTLTLEEQLLAAQKQLDEENLKSTVSGTVTAVNVKKGDIYQGGTILTIEGSESFIVEAKIDEYDIADIKEGMEAIIKTESTRDEELQGKVIFVAPSSSELTNNNAMSSSSSLTTGSTNATSTGATYLVKIEILTSNDRLRLGMGAKVNIISKKVEDALTVPYEAITEKDDGSKYITVVKDDDTQQEIKVEVGLESGYYSEIKSDKLKEGMKVVLPKEDKKSSLDEIINSMGATGGIE